jgi:hypothetical protein
MHEVSRWMVALGSVFATVGFVFLGVGTSFVRPQESDITVGWILMIGGSVVGLLGWVLFRRTEGPDTSID